MTLQMLGKRITQFTILGLLVGSIATVLYSGFNGGYEFRGIVFGFIMYGMFIVIFFTLPLLLLILYERTIFSPVLLIAFFTIVELVSIGENLKVKYFAFLVPLGSILYVVGLLKKRRLEKRQV